MEEVPVSSSSSRRIWIAGGIFVVLLLAFGVSAYAYAASYEDRVLPGVHIGDIGLGGMKKDELTSFLRSMNDKFVTTGVHVAVKIDTKMSALTLYPVITGGDATVALVDLDVGEESGRLLRYGKEGNVISRMFRTIGSAVSKPDLRLEHLVVNDGQLKEVLVGHANEYGRAPVSANVQVSSVSPLAYTIVPAQTGVNFDYDRAVASIREQWFALELPQVTLAAGEEAPAISEADVTTVVARLHAALGAGLTLTYQKEGVATPLTWEISPSRLAQMVEVQKKDHTILIGLSKDEVLSYFAYTIAPDVTVPAQDAKFLVDTNGKVGEFKDARAGVALDMEATYAAMNASVTSRVGEGFASAPIALFVTSVEPTINTGSINSLGITEILGTGTSNFAGSPKNRVLNIKNAVEKLNGVLVPPGAEFSTISSTLPYTLEGGYLPELVIKGDALKPEIGGGLCQVGSTLFRMAMNSGMPITERRNHSLAVSYYNDPSNGLPGTDATIYEPSPDFKFKNDTANYVLVQSSMNEKTGDLSFTLWGTSDGRKGYYTAPEVTKWYPAGEKRVVPTTKLPPGKEECQKSFRGANASFTYIRELPDGTKDERVFESYYRPLPQICLVGVAAPTEECVPSADGSVTCPAPEPLDETLSVVPVPVVTQASVQ